MMLRKNFVFIVVIATLISSLNATYYSAVFTAHNDVPFSISFIHDEKIECDYKQNGAENIKIDVYSSYMTSESDDIGIMVFEHTYAFSVFTNKMGTVEFNRPTEYFYISIDITTLPKDTILKESSKFYSPNNINDEIIIYDKDSADFIQSQKNQSINYLYQTNLDSTVLSEERSRDNTLEFMYNELNKIKESSKESVSCVKSANGFDSSSLIEFASNSVDKNIITKLDLLQFLIEVYDNVGRNTELCMVLNGLIKDKSFYNNLCEDQKNMVQKMLEESYYNKVFTNGYFEIYYESYDTDTPLFIHTLASVLNTVYNDLIIDSGLNRPKSATVGGNDKYIIYVDSASDDAEAMTIPILDTTGASYILIPNITNLNMSITNSLTGTMAHEYMHAIMHNYKELDQLPLWFVESWAEWAVYKVFGLNSYYHGTYYANEYLDHIGNSLISNDYVYGKVLYPLFLEQRYGGEDMLISIIDNLPIAVDAYSAISIALLAYNTTFDTCFQEFGKFIYAPKYFYNPFLSGWSDKPYIRHTYDLNSYPSNQFDIIVPLSMQYSEFTLPTGSTSYNISITISVDDDPSILKCKMFLNESDGDIVTTSSFITFGTNIATVYYCGANNEYVTGALMVSNISHSVFKSYYYTIGIS